MKNKALWGLQGFVALAFLTLGGAKLAGVPMMVGTFEHIGIGQWFRYVTALPEISGAIMLLTSRFSGLGAVLFACIMFYATLNPASHSYIKSISFRFFYDKHLIINKT
jgi:uncharacterized membrane protein YphA (DoxX/SURF4 family)